MRMHEIGDYYDVPELSHLAEDKIKTALRTDWSSRAFLDAISEKEVVDEGLKSILAAAAIDHITELSTFGLSDNSLEGVSQFAVELLRACARKVQKDAEKIKLLEDRLGYRMRWYG